MESSCALSGTGTCGGPVLKQSISDGLWKKPTLEQFMKDCIPWEWPPQCSRQRLWEGQTAAAKINFYELAANQIPHPPAPFGTKEVEDTGVKFSLGRRRGGGNMCLFLSFASHQTSLVLIGNKLDQSPHGLVFSLTQSFLSSFSPCPAEEKERPLGG